MVLIKMTGDRRNSRYSAAVVLERRKRECEHILSHDDGVVNVKLGCDGYNSTKTEKYPNGQPNVLIARSVNSGTTFRKKTKFVDKAVDSAKNAAEAAMDAACSREIEKIMK